MTIHATDPQARFMLLLTDEEHAALVDVVLENRSKMLSRRIQAAVLAKILTPLEIEDVCPVKRKSAKPR